MIDGEISVLIGGRAGEGISSAGQIIAQILGNLGYRVHMYLDYPSRIKGGHNFAIIRGGGFPVGSVRYAVDILLAMNQETVDLHRSRLKDGGTGLYRADTATMPNGIGVDIGKILASEKAPPVMGNAVMLGAFARATGIGWEVADTVFRKSIPKELELNLRVARSAYDTTPQAVRIPPREKKSIPVFSGNEALGIGLIEGGCSLYCGYPMSPISNLLHFLVSQAKELPVRVIQPESETAAILMVLGSAFAGTRAAVGTSGGGFCLMTEALGLAGIAELPVMIILGQRAGPSTGLATYTAQADLQFALWAGQGEFPRLIVAPGDADEARFWAARGMDLSWKYQLPAILLADRILCEGMYSLDPVNRTYSPIEPIIADREIHPYLRYALGDSGISPLRFPPVKGEIIRVNSHVHDEDGITTEDATMTKAMADKRFRKMEELRKEIGRMNPVKVDGEKDASTAILCWGSNKGICNEIGLRLGLRVIQPVVIWPFPETQFAQAMTDVERWFGVETNETGQLARLVQHYGYRQHDLVLKYDGRPFFVEDLEAELSRRVA